MLKPITSVAFASDISTNHYHVPFNIVRVFEQIFCVSFFFKSSRSAFTNMLLIVLILIILPLLIMNLILQGRLLLAARSGRILARSFHVLAGEALGHVGSGRTSALSSGSPVIAWKRRELSVILEHVQAHIAPTDVDPGAGLQWLPRIPISVGAPKIKRTGTLLEQVFMPCTMYFQYTRQKGGTTDSKVVVLISTPRTNLLVYIIMTIRGKAFGRSSSHCVCFCIIFYV